MADDPTKSGPLAPSTGDPRQELEALILRGKGPGIARFLLGALGGAIPVAGGVFGAGASAWSEREQSRINELIAAWLKMQAEEIQEIGNTLVEALSRLDPDDDAVRERLHSPEYLSIVRKCFRDWSAGESEFKRRMIRDLLGNAAASRLCSDDMVKLFIEWIGKYSEAHFKVVKTVYHNQGFTRLDVWMEIHGEDVRENSAEADLFKLICHDLSTGHVLRQERPTDQTGRFLRRPNPKRRAPTPYMKSAFDDEKPYVLTELGQQFVHYAMTETVKKIEAS